MLSFTSSPLTKLSLLVSRVCLASQNLCFLQVAAFPLACFGLFLSRWSYFLSSLEPVVVCLHFSVGDVQAGYNSGLSRPCGPGSSLQGDLVGMVSWSHSNTHIYTRLSSGAAWIPQTRLLWSLAWRLRAWLPVLGAEGEESARGLGLYDAHFDWNLVWSRVLLASIAPNAA